MGIGLGLYGENMHGALKWEQWYIYGDYMDSNIGIWVTCVPVVISWVAMLIA